MKRISSGIEGLDELTGGGFIKGSNVMIFGKAGSGKTIMSLEYIYKGAVMGEAGLFVSFDQTEEQLIEQCIKLGWDVKKYMRKGLMKIYALKIEDVDRDFVIKVFEEAGKVKAERMALDNLTLLAMSPFFLAGDKKFSILYQDKIRVSNTPKQLVYNLVTILKDIPTTTIYVSGLGDEPTVTSDGISEYLCDGVVKLDIRSIGKSFLRTLEVQKMRRSSIKGGIHGFKITDEGIQVGP